MNELNLDYKVMTPRIIGALCSEIHPESSNEIEAVDIHCKYLYNLIQLKLSANIPTAKDIEFYFVLLSAKRELMQSLTINELNNDANRNRN
jgi:hypothetical protein